MAEPLLKFASEVLVKDGVITVIMSNETADRDEDIVRAAGWDLANFSKAPRLMSCHDYSALTSQIGEWRDVRVDQRTKALIGEPHYYTGQGNPEADWGYYLASIGQATYSVGFNPIEWEPRKGAGRGQVYTRQELLECSHVPIPSNPDALQLMAKAFRLRQQGTRQPGRTVQKWASQFMDDDGDGYGPRDTRCLVPGCDDASQTFAPVCSEHLKVLMNADAEPPGGEADEEAEALMRSFTRSLRVKAGRSISAANMTKLHGALQSLHDVHDAHCADDPCPLADDGTDEPATSRDKAMGESGSAGATVSDSGTHGAFTGKHEHPHADGSGDTHEHPHSHEGDGDHGHAHSKSVDKSHSELPDSAFAYIEPGGKVKDGKTSPLSLRHYPHHTASGALDTGLLRSALSRIADENNEQGGKAHLLAHRKEAGIGDDEKAFDLSAALDAVFAVRTRRYSATDVSSLPANVQDLDAEKRRKWVATWNSVYDDCKADGGNDGDCETKAFKIANGTIGSGKSFDFARELEDALAALAL